MSKKDKTNSVNNEKIMDPIEYLEKTGLTSSVKEVNILFKMFKVFKHFETRRFPIL